LEITNDIHLGLKIGCCNAENRRNEVQGKFFDWNKKTEAVIETSVLQKVNIIDKKTYLGGIRSIITVRL
jgi:hypothetical protein